MKVEIWSDVVCPWCYVGKRSFEAALARFPHRDEIEVVWRSYELDPDGPREREGRYVDRLARKYRTTVEQAQGMIDRMVQAGAGAGIDFRFDISRAGNTFDAHRLLHLAAERGVQDAVKERFLLATFTEGEPIGDPDTLVRLAAEAGLDADEARAVLESGKFADDVRGDERLAAEIGITGVPFFVVDGTRGISGAQPPEILLRVLQRAWDETRRAPVVVEATGGDDAACEGDSCAV